MTAQLSYNTAVTKKSQSLLKISAECFFPKRKIKLFLSKQGAHIFVLSPQL